MSDILAIPPITLGALNARTIRDVAATVTTSGPLIPGIHNPVDATSGPLTMTLPTGMPAGTPISVGKFDSSQNVITITGAIDGVGGSTRTLSLPKATNSSGESTSYTMKADGSWWTDGGHKSLAGLKTVLVAHGDLLFNVKDYGTKGDGTTDDAAAVRACIAAASAAGGGVVYFPPGTYVLQTTNAIPIALTIPANVTLRGVKGYSFINLTADVVGVNRGFATNAGANVTIDGLIITRTGSDFYATLIEIQPYDNFTFSNSTLDGNNVTYSTAGCTGFHFGKTNGTHVGLYLTNSTVQRCRWGIYSDNGSTVTCSRIVVDQCLFSANAIMDLNFNGPSATISDVWVLDSRFLNNTSSSGGGGAFGLARVARATFRGNLVQNYLGEAIHIEDSSSDVDIIGNKLVNCATARDQAIGLIGLVTRIKITENVIDNAASTLKTAAILGLKNATYTTGTTVGAQAIGSAVTLSVTAANPSVMPVGAVLGFTGGGLFTVTVASPGSPSAISVTGNLVGAAVTAGEGYKYYSTPSGVNTGLPNIAPNHVTVANNQIMLGAYNDGIVAYAPAHWTITGNKVVGLTALGGANNQGGITLSMLAGTPSVQYGFANVVSNNTIENVSYGLNNAVATVNPASQTFGNGTVVSGNVFYACQNGIDARHNAPGVVLSNNAFYSCSRPWYIGTGNTVTNSYTAHPIVVTGNHAYNCTLPMDINGSIGNIVCNGAATSGATSLAVVQVPYYFPVGTAITFTGGGVFTVTTAAQPTSSPFTLTGTLTGANVALNEVGGGTIAHSTITAESHRSFNANADSTNLPSYEGNPATLVTTNLLTNGEETIPRNNVLFAQSVCAVSCTSGELRGAQFTARKTETITQVKMVSNSTAAAATPTLCRIGVYSVDAYNTHTLVASIANDTTLFATVNTVYTRTLSSSFVKTAGVRYAVCVLIVSAAAVPTLVGQPQSPEMYASPSLATRMTGQTDLPSSITVGSLVSNASPLYAVLLP